MALRSAWLSAAATALVGCGAEFEPADSSAGGGGSTSTTTATTTDTGTTGSGAGPVGAIGCSDGEREGLASADDIAACAGGFSEAGLAQASICSRGAGDDSANAVGDGCTAADLCANGWHVCADVDEVTSRIGSAADCASITGGFYASLVTTTPAGVCTDGATGGVAGCGFATGIFQLADVSCGPLSAALTPLFCETDNSWVCGSASPIATAYKTRATGGGVLCCR